MKRVLGRSGIEVSAIGLGCWAIGGPWTFRDYAAGWGEVDDDESIRAIHRALELGVNFFDTAANYGSGHSEEILGRAVSDRRDQVVIATKFGYDVNEKKNVVTLYDDVVGNIRKDCDASLRRLGTDYIDLFQFHIGNYDPNAAVEVRDVLEALVAEGKIRAYGWSTDHEEGAKVFAQGSHCCAIQHRMNVLEDDPEILAVCDQFDLASVVRGPLMRAVLTGKFTRKTTFPDNDIRQGMRADEEHWTQMIDLAQALRGILTQDGRTPAQGALAWIWARSPRSIPIPGFKTIKQVEENIGALELGPLSEAQMKEIEEILAAETH
jgi:aryl-alcohol dehydrogenase-like predicted oxidoreductase